MRRKKSELELHLEAATVIMKQLVKEKTPLTPGEVKDLHFLLSKSVTLESEVKILFRRHRLHLELAGRQMEEKKKSFIAFVEDIYLYISEFNQWTEDIVTYGFVEWFHKAFVSDIPDDESKAILQRMVKHKYKYK